MERGQAARLSSRVCEHVRESDVFRAAAYLYAYAPMGSEVDIRAAVTAAWREGKRVAFPQVCGEEMRFLEVTDFGQLAPGAYGIPEPDEAAGAVPVDWRGDPGLLVLVPGVAFDRSGHRLGHGKGYYDRHFADSADALLGIAFSCQMADALPAEPHDLRLTHLVTEKGSVF